MCAEYQDDGYGVKSNRDGIGKRVEGTRPPIALFGFFAATGALKPTLFLVVSPVEHAPAKLYEE
ncbi:hypothetical protein GRAN_1443 [Granulicella sibirica]|uniref:Uncharacterized protein n=1 Tax=Granulicella sibirica TaxID=2479048 RepID=A0A4Q0T3F9_9BACT|nr:hypothetical protein GRAN_1443 [Granulicella sibirica]